MNEPVILEAMKRIEDKLDLLLAALAEEQVDEPERTLDGAIAGRERDQMQDLG